MMYEIKLNDTVIHENSADSLKRLSAGVLAEDINQIPSFSFTIPPMNPLFSQELHDRTDTVTATNTLTNEVEFEGHLLSSSSAMGADGRLCKKAVAEGHLGYLCDSIQMYHNFENTAPADFLDALLTAHNAQVTASGHPEKTITLGDVDVQGNTNSKTTAYRNTLEEIRVNLIERLGGEIRVRRVNGGLVLDYLQSIGVTSSTTVELAKNMKALSVDVDTTNVITRLIPLGAQLHPGDSAERLTISSVNSGLPYIDDNNGIAKYGIIAGTAEFDDITDANNLKTAGQNYLANNNRIRKAYEAQALDLSLLDASQQALRCGNTYTFKNRLMGIDEPLRLIGRIVDIFKPYTPTLRIGDKSVRITDIATRTAKLIEYDLPKMENEMLSSAKTIATNIINAGINGYVVVNANEILIMDTPDKNTATKVWRWNSGGFGYSSHGYNGPYSTAITMNGAIVADFITAGILRGIEIINGNGTFHVNSDGTVTASAINITGGSIHVNTNSASNDIIQLTCNEHTSKQSPVEILVSNSVRGDEIKIQAGLINFASGGYTTLQLVTSTGAILFRDRNGNLRNVGDEIQQLWDTIAFYHPVGGN